MHPEGPVLHFQFFDLDFLSAFAAASLPAHERLTLGLFVIIPKGQEWRKHR
jgi:hypothetical protein